MCHRHSEYMIIIIFLGSEIRNLPPIQVFWNKRSTSGGAANNSILPLSPSSVTHCHRPCPSTLSPLPKRPTPYPFPPPLLMHRVTVNCQTLNWRDRPTASASYLAIGAFNLSLGSVHESLPGLVPAMADQAHSKVHDLPAAKTWGRHASS